MKKNTHVFIDQKKYKQMINKQEFYDEIVSFNKTDKCSKKLHEMLHLLSYKVCVKYIRGVFFYKLSYDDFVTDVYLKLYSLLIKFDVEKSKEPFSYFTTCAIYESMLILKKNRKISEVDVTLFCDFESLTYDDRAVLSNYLDYVNSSEGDGLK